MTAQLASEGVDVSAVSRQHKTQQKRTHSPLWQSKMISAGLCMRLLVDDVRIYCLAKPGLLCRITHVAPASKQLHNAAP
eukprot:2081695-Pleurochrysis_carterae.AAC.1